MTPKLEQFVNTVVDYPRFKAQFSKFCETSARILNNNEELPGVSFSADSYGIAAKVVMLDHTFVVRFHLFGLDSARVGVFGVYLPIPEGKEILLWYTFFDILGNVRDTFDATSSLCGLRDTDFLNMMLGEFTDRYFSHMRETFKVGAPPPQ